MKLLYCDFEINVKREKCLAGYSMLYYSLFKDDTEIMSYSEDSAETVKDKVKQLKAYVDDYILEDYEEL